MQTHDKKNRRRRLAPAMTAVATAGLMAVGFTQLGGASALTPSNGGSCSNGTSTTATGTIMAGRAGVMLGKPTKPKTVTVTRTKTITKWKTVHHCKTVTVTETATATETETETTTETVTPTTSTTTDDSTVTTLTGLPG